jgi:dipeptidyl aminopeptidase/acylaminoacyl peptidase
VSLREIPEFTSRRTRRSGVARWMFPRWLRTRAVAGLVVLFAVLASAVGVQANASASPDGPFAQEEVHIDPGNGFGGGTIHLPVGKEGKLPAVVIVPALAAGRGYYEWNGAKLATHGFISFVIDTNDPGELWDQRKDALLAAADYLVQSSPVRDRVDGGRIAVEGHSAGAVGAIKAGLERSSLKAVVALAAVSAGIGPGDVTNLNVPTIFIGGTNDGWAHPNFLQTLADAMPPGTPKRVVSLEGEGHGFPTGDGNGAFDAELSWLKQYLGE